MGNLLFDDWSYGKQRRVIDRVILKRYGALI